MPTYEYRCDTCHSRFETTQSFSDDALTRCPGKRAGGPVTEACTSPGKGRVVKVFSSVGISFKGEGFYKNDHGAGAKAKAKAESNGSSDSSDTKSSSDSDKSSSDKSSGDRASGDRASGDRASKQAGDKTSKSSSGTKASSSGDKN